MEKDSLDMRPRIEDVDDETILLTQKLNEFCKKRTERTPHAYLVFVACDLSPNQTQAIMAAFPANLDKAHPENAGISSSDLMELAFGSVTSSMGMIRQIRLKQGAPGFEVPLFLAGIKALADGFKLPPEVGDSIAGLVMIALSHKPAEVKAD